MNWVVPQASALKGEVKVPGDKSITHRALLLGAFAEGPSRIKGFLDGGDCRATMGCLRQMGVRIDELNGDSLLVHGVGVRGLQEPGDVLDCVRSGTTMRLLSGWMAGQPFYSVLSADPQLLRRPMDRITTPLRMMGAQIWGRQEGRLPPLSIQGGSLKGIRYELPMASAQVKSCVLLAGLLASGETTAIEPGPARDHTERMLRARGVPVVDEGLAHTVSGPIERIDALDTDVPGDFSSAAYFVTAGCLQPGNEITIWNVGINPTRTGLLDALRAMGANIVTCNQRDQGGEPVADLWIRGSELTPASLQREIVPRMIDEFPLLALAATQAQGTTRITNAEELRHKETDRIDTTVEAFRAMGANIEPLSDGFEITGPTPLVGAKVDSYGDHRLAMTLAIAACIAKGETTIARAECIADSFPGFQSRLHDLSHRGVA